MAAARPHGRRVDGKSDNIAVGKHVAVNTVTRPSSVLRGQTASPRPQIPPPRSRKPPGLQS
jgi:hypothetical protein